MEPAKAELLGFLAAEGNEYYYIDRHYRFFPGRGPLGKWYLINYRQSAIEFTNVEPVIQQRFYGLLVKVYGKQKSSFGSRCRIRIRPRKMVSDLLDHSRLGCLQWQVPSEVLKNKDQRVKAAWCRGYADGDGTVQPYEVDFDSANRSGLEQVQDLLQSLGIRNKLRGPYRRAPYLDRFTLAIPKTSLPRYAEPIGFNHPSRKRRLNEALKKKPGGSRVIVVPPGKQGTPCLLPGGIASSQGPLLNSRVLSIRTGTSRDQRLERPLC